MAFIQCARKSSRRSYDRKTVSVIWNRADGAIKAAITELRPLVTFATWQAERVIGDHDRNTLRLRLDPEAEPADLEPGMTVWIEN